MRVLVLGSGAREHAVAWKFSRSRRISGLFVAPGNAGTDQLGTNIPVDPMDADAVIAACRENRINLAFVGPEGPLAAGLVDRLAAQGIQTIGPPAAAAQLESSKAFSKDFMWRHGVPTAHYSVCTTEAEVDRTIDEAGGALVVKMSGLASGKGVFDSGSTESLRKAAHHSLREGPVVIEERLEGFEVSVFALLDGSSFRLLLPCSDYKKAGEGGTGPNTGGMGAVCPVPWLGPEDEERIRRTIVEPTVGGLRQEGLMYTGVLYFGIMVCADGPKLLEYNVRFGDPETQVLLPLIRSDMGDVCAAMAEGAISDFPLELSERCALGVVIAAAGYPGEYQKGVPVTLEGAPSTSTPPQGMHPANELIFHASTVVDDNGTVLTGGGRCFTVVGLGDSLLDARRRAYNAALTVTFDGAWHRGDIGDRVFGT